MPPTAMNRRRYLQYLFAGLETGVLGGLLALAWYGFSSIWQGHSVLAAPVRMGVALFDGLTIHSGFGAAAAAGAAFQIVACGLYGALFGLAVREGGRVSRTMLLGLVFALVCYYLFFDLLWQRAMPAAPLPASAHSVLVAHLLFGAHLGRYPRLLRSLRDGSDGSGSAGKIV